jgi:hypothetical protein
MATFSLYHQAQASAWSGEVNWVSDAITATLHAAGYTPNLDTHRFVSDLSAELVTGLGYASGGQQLAGRGASFIPAGSWPDTWAPVTAYVTGQIVRPALSPQLLFRCYAPGTSGAVAPAWPTAPGATVTDGSVSWAAIGSGAVALTAAQLIWTGFGGTFRYIVLSDRTPPAATAQPLIAVADMGGPASGTGGNLDIIFDSGSGSGLVIPLWAM